MEKISTGINRNPNFDWLRLFLAASVAYAHAGYYSSITNGHDAPVGFLPFPMVPTFLALSGYLMLDSISRSRSWLDFWKKRALRIFPALILGLIVSGLVWGWHDGFIASLRTYIGGGFIISGGGNGSFWSLLWEEIAYALMAILVSLKAYKRPIIIWLALAISCYVAYLHNQIEPWWRVYNLAPGLFVGNLARMYQAKIQRANWKLVLATILAITFTLKFIGVPPQTWFMVPVGASLALTLCLSLPALPKLPGDFSYGLYLYHDPIYVMATRIAPHSFFTIFGLGTPCLIALACLSWFLIEKPALRLKSRVAHEKNALATLA